MDSAVERASFEELLHAVAEKRVKMNLPALILEEKEDLS